MSKYYVRISGEHIALARAEVESLLSMMGVSSSTVSWNGQIGLIESTICPIELILDRAALVKEAGFVLAESDESSTLSKSLVLDDFSDHLDTSGSFCLSTHVINTDSQRDRQELINEFGNRIRTITSAKVSLKTPDTTFLLLVDKHRIYLCKSMKSHLRKELRERTPGKKIFFHPSMMNSHLARVMCNLAEVKENNMVLDPFCGGGGILCESLMIGAKTIGVDLNWRLLKGASANLSAINNTGYSLLQGDARFLPIRHYDSIVTDPPYGRSSSTRGAIARQLISKVLSDVIDTLDTYGTLCICGSTDLELSELAKNIGVNLTYKILMPVHGGLTREIISAKL